MRSTVGTITSSSFHAATTTVTSGHVATDGGSRYGASVNVNAINPITRLGMYASSVGITHAITGPSASSSSPRQGPEAQTANATQPAVKRNAITKRTVGRIPNCGCERLVNHPRTDPGVGR